MTAADPRSESLRRVRVVAREEFRRALESRWMFGAAVVFAAFVLALSFLGLAQSGEVGFTGFARVTLSLLDLVLFIVPLVGLLIGVMSLTGSAGTLALLLAQPVSRGEVLLGKFAGLAAALAVAQSIGLGAGGLVVAFNTGAEQLAGYAVLCLLAILLGTLSIAAAFAIATRWPEKLRAVGTALALWLVLAVAYDLAVLGASSLLRGVSLQAVLLPALLLNPIDLTRVLVTLAVGQGALFGPTAAVLMRVAGTQAGIAAGVSVLLLETLLPLALALHTFRRRDP